jgi:hypothetical protein
MRRRRRARAGLTGCCLLALLPLLLGACAGPRSELGLSDGSCYVALPAAAAAVQHHGRLIGVRLVNVRSLGRTEPAFHAATAGVGGRVCLVAFRGHFTPDDVVRPFGRTPGPVAVAVLTYPGNRLLGTVLTPHPHLHFGHSRLAG